MHVKPSATGTPEPTLHRNPAQAEVLPLTHYENFPVASWLCPPRLRPPIAALYHFLRTADDIADEGDDSPAQRLATLAAYQAELHATLTHPAGPVAGGRWQPVLAPLARQQAAWPAGDAAGRPDQRLHARHCLHPRPASVPRPGQPARLLPPLGQPHRAPVAAPARCDRCPRPGAERRHLQRPAADQFLARPEPGHPAGPPLPH